MSSRFRPVRIAAFVAVTLAGCNVDQPGPIRYAESPYLTRDVTKDVPNLAGKPNLQKWVRQTTDDLFGSDPQQIKVPPGAGSILQKSGYLLANYRNVDGVPRKQKTADGRSVEGGYALYRKHCLHCHGVTGDGNGPTAAFLFPKPRDFRNGVFKFTSTPNGAKPTRSDLRKTLVNGVHGTSMPAFQALMSGDEIEQTLDYLLYLSLRGETEISLIREAGSGDEDEAGKAQDAKTFWEGLSVEPQEVVDRVIANWKRAEEQVLRPQSARTASTGESIARGRALFLDVKVGCVSCHGDRAQGNGVSFIEKPIFDRVVFGRKPLTEAITEEHSVLEDRAEGAREHASAGHTPPTVEPLDEYLRKKTELWGQSLNVWGEPLRPANLHHGVYKGGRRPIDLYWRIANGITGAKMPAHYPSLLTDAQIWDVVNFILALPYQPDLLPPPSGDSHVPQGTTRMAGR